MTLYKTPCHLNQNALSFKTERQGIFDLPFYGDEI